MSTFQFPSRRLLLRDDERPNRVMNVRTGKPPPSNDVTENGDVLLPAGSNDDGDDDANVESEEQNDVSASASSVSLVTGLRGLLALYIAVFHFILYSKQEIDICGSGIMSYWFLLSGFACSRTYSTREDKWTSEFYRNRFARIAPLYWLTNAFAMPLAWLGRSWIDGNNTGQFVGAFVGTVTGVWMWFPFFGSFNGPGWTISSLFFMWLTFPKLSEYLFKMNSCSCRDIWICYVLQFFGAFLLYGITSPFLGPWLAFMISTFWPVSRYPLFVMGCIAGTQSEMFPELMPIAFANNLNYLVPACFKYRNDSVSWSRLVDLNVILSFFVIVTSVVVKGMTGVETGCGFWMQLLLPITYLTIIVGLSFIDEGSYTDSTQSYSYFARLCATSLLQFLGEISYALYLVHVPIMDWFGYMHGGKLTRPTCNGGGDDKVCDAAWYEYNRSKLVPIWMVAPLTFLSILFAFVLTRRVETPCRHFLRSAKSSPPRRQNPRRRV